MFNSIKIRPTISVIVPVYNTEKYLNRCIDSILSQTFSDFELLLIDDGSTDNSGTICDEYVMRDSRVRVFHKANEGVSLARNLGVNEASGEWIAFIDADDWILDTYLATFVNYINKGAQILVATTKEMKVESSDFIKKLLLYTVPCGMPFKLYSIGCLRNQDHLCVPREINIGEDLIANLSIAKSVETVQYVINDGYCVNHINFESVTRSRSYSLEYEISFLGYIKKIIGTNPEYYPELWILMLRCIKTLMVNGVHVPRESLLYQEVRNNRPHVLPPLGKCDKIVLYSPNSTIARWLLLLKNKITGLSN